MPYVRGSLRKSKERKTDMKERVFCDLEGLAGVRRRKVGAYAITEADALQIKSILESKHACTSAGSYGAINIWKTDAGEIRGEAMQNLCSLEVCIFATYAKAAEWAQKWLDRINGRDIVETSFDEPNYAFKRDVERIMMASRKNMLDAFCTAVCNNWQNHDGNGNPCPRNCCPKFNKFVEPIKTTPIRGLETTEAKEAVNKYINDNEPRK